ncbi:MAG: hypothetical protein AABZ06_02285, partial [Bdellovibrionota bacterium]
IISPECGIGKDDLTLWFASARNAPVRPSPPAERGQACPPHKALAGGGEVERRGDVFIMRNVDNSKDKPR